MFLIIFVKPYSREIGFAGGYRVMETGERLYLFFIPTFGWNRQYFAVAADGTAYPISAETANAVKHGKKQSIDAADFIGPACGTIGEEGSFSDSCGNGARGSFGNGFGSGAQGSSESGFGSRPGVRRKKCPYCGFSTTENFTYCPKCAERLEDVRD